MQKIVSSDGKEMSDDLVKRLRDYSDVIDSQNQGPLLLSKDIAVSLVKAINEAADALERQIPDGWKVVPIEPTFTQALCGLAEYDKAENAASLQEIVENIYKTMVAASPPPAKREG